MAAFNCRFCGAALELSESRVCECRGCGRLQSVPLLDSEEKRELITRAEQLRAEGRYDKAVELFERMVQLSPTDADLYWGLALCRFGVGFFLDGGVSLNKTQAHSFLTDSDYHQALRFADGEQREFFEQTALHIDQKCREIAEIAAGQKFDIFLCCRENNENGFPAEDVKCASELYKRLSVQGLSVFFPKITLEDKAGSEWEPYISGALNSAKVMLVICSVKNCLDDVFVSGVLGRFSSEGLAGKAIIPILNGITPAELPEELSHFQAVDASALGFEHDLVLSIRALLNKEITENISSEKSPLVRRAYLFLEDGDRESAKRICERIGQTEPAEAALIRLLIESGAKTEEELDKLAADITVSENYRLAMQNGNEALRARLKKHAEAALNNLHAKTEEIQSVKSSKNPIEVLPSGVYSSNAKPAKCLSPFVIVSAAGGVCLAIIAAILLARFCGKPSEKIDISLSQISEISGESESFERAKALYDEGRYADAEAVFLTLGDYGNSKSMVRECRYMQAEELLSGGEIEKARSIFGRLGSHRNSAERVKKCDYILAEKMESSGELLLAADAFDALGYYSDSMDRASACRYRVGVDYLDKGDFEEAADIFSGLGRYSDSAKMLLKSRYGQAEALLESHDYTSAYELYKGLGSYEDSAEKALESRYLQAKQLLEDNQESKAMTIFEALGDYKDSKELYSASWLNIAIKTLNSGDKNRAYTQLLKVKDYPPAQKYIASLRNEVLNGGGWSMAIYLGEYNANLTNSKSNLSWRVIKRNGNMALVVSESAIDYLPFDRNGGSSWANSSLRAWLNGEFYENTFSASEKALIAGGNDKIILLTLDEAVQYFDRAVSPDKLPAYPCARKKIPKDNSALYSWGIDGVLGRTPTPTGYNRVTLPTTQPGLVYPAMWVKIE
ncbi:MAG: tetratricopeptide repeat protein [Oscillospiraceae bacterium]